MVKCSSNPPTSCPPMARHSRKLRPHRTAKLLPRSSSISKRRSSRVAMRVTAIRDPHATDHMNAVDLYPTWFLFGLLLQATGQKHAEYGPRPLFAAHADRAPVLGHQLLRNPQS